MVRSKVRFWGSTLAFILGLLVMAGGLASIARTSSALTRLENQAKLTAQVDINKAKQMRSSLEGHFETFVFGSMAYRSAKRRKYRMTQKVKARKFIELILICIILFLAFSKSNLIRTIESYPVTSLIIPLWTLIAYFAIVLKKDIKSIG
jgi:hypothetical protein